MYGSSAGYPRRHAVLRFAGIIVKKSVQISSNSSKDVAAFLQKTRTLQTMISHGGNPGRLAFMIDATASRQPAWDRACRIQGQMFKAVEQTGRLQIQLVYFRGFAEFHASAWLADSQSLLHEMTGVQCLAGHTQIERSLRHLIAETTRQPVAAAVYIGDACEENSASILQLAGQLGVRSTPLFVFHEGQDPRAADIFESMAKLSHGAYCRFDSGSAGMLSELLSAVAVYAAGGKAALQALAAKGTPQLQQLTGQLLR
jgi:hypothetical protein